MNRGLNLNVDKNLEVTKIYHMADIHIRKQFHRRKEYQDVFERLYMILRSRNDGNSIIVICGDLFFEKDDFNNYSMDDAFVFLENLADIMPVVIIAGNHDSVTSKDEVIDSISTISKRVYRRNKLYYLQKSGVYDIFMNIIFGVSSFIDDKFIEAKEIKSNKIKIALFHGSVKGSKLQNNIEMEIYEKELSEFNGYDYVLLGDIHKFQYLGKNKRAAYPSSLIQQSHGEDLYDHGFIEWNLMNGASEFIRVDNDYGYLTINIDDGKNIQLPPKMPKNCRLYTNFKGITKNDCSKILKELKTSMGINIIENRYNEILDNGILKNVDREKDIQNIKNIENQNKLIINYCQDILKLDKESIRNILALNKRLNSSINYKELAKGKKWKLLTLRFSNMFIYGENNFIDFTKKSGIIGLISPNYSGKSSVIDIIIFALFNKIMRGSEKQSDLLNIYKNIFMCEVEISIDKNKYKILKTSKTTKIYDPTSLRVDVEIFQEINGKYVYLFDKSPDVQKDKTDKLKTLKLDFIKDIVGDKDHFLYTHVLLQRGENFKDQSPTKRIKYLEKVFGIDIFNNLEMACKQEKVDYQKKSDELAKKINKRNPDEIKSNISLDYKKLEEIESKLSSIGKEIDNIKKLIKINCEKKTIDIDFKKIEKYKDTTETTIQKWNDEYLDYDKKINTLIKSEKNLNENINEFNKKYSKEIINKIQKDNEQFENKIISEIDDISLKIKKLLNKKKDMLVIDKKEDVLKLEKEKKNEEKNINNDIKKFNELIKDLEKSIEDVKNADEINRNYDLLLKLKNDKKSLEKDKMFIELKIEEMVEICKEFENFNFDPNCKYCVENPFTKRAQVNKNDLERQKIILKEINQEINYISKNINELQNYELEYNKLKDKIINNESKKNLIISYKEKYQNLTHKLTINLMEQEQINDKLNNINKNQKNIDFNNNIKNQIDELQEKKDKLNMSEFSDYINLEKAIEENNNNSIKLSNIIIEKNDIQIKLNNVKNIITEYNECREELEFHKLNSKIESEITKLEYNLYEREKELDELKILRIRKNDDIKQNELILENYNYESNELKKNEAKLKTYENYLLIVEKSGLPCILLKNMVNKLQIYSNELLKKLTDFSIEIYPYIKEMSKTKKTVLKSIDIYKLIGDKKLNVTSCSTSEEFMTNFAIRMAIIHLSNLNKSNFMAIDEGFSCMDSTSLARTENLFAQLRQDFDFVILISHLDNMKNNCDNYIKIFQKINMDNFESHINSS